MKTAIKHWLKIAESDHDACLYLFKGAKYPQAIYFLCQSIEKLLKALIVETTNIIPERSHRLENLAKRIKSISLTTEQTDVLTDLSKHYSRVRYRDISQAAYNTKRKTESIIEKGKDIYLWLHKMFKTL